MDNSPFIMDDLWGSVLEELRAECADAYEIVMRVRPREKGEMGNSLTRKNVKINEADAIFSLAGWKCGSAQIFDCFHNLRPLATDHPLWA